MYYTTNSLRCIDGCKMTLSISENIASNISDIASMLGISVVEACNEFLSIAGATCAYLIAESGEVEERDDADDDGAAGR